MIKDKIRDLWSPRTEIGRSLKHKLLFGDSPPMRQFRHRFDR